MNNEKTSLQNKIPTQTQNKNEIKNNEKEEGKFALIYSYKDPAGKNIAKKIQEIGIPKWATLYEVEEDIVYADLSKIKEDYLIFLSKHQSETGTKALTIHMIGNFGEAKFGGRARELCGAMPRVGANYLRALNEKNQSEGLAKQGFVVTMEATHHGPYTKKDCLFIEIGSSPKEWNNELAAKIVAEVVITQTQKQNKDTIVVGLGGGHYTPEFTKLALRQKYAFGHICPKHNLENLNLDLLWEMIRKSGADEIVLDWKGLKENKAKIVELTKITKLKINRVQNLLK
ncbi:MAG: D-aminoacyl-tRNA deacylase [Candidatus Iainarchaeum sp.]|jgi:D-aminoacyl-tRNA deacylase|nr:MAG: D-tyrosyl-tRNA(Tyr) deacylase [archaeon ADurb.Bin336]